MNKLTLALLFVGLGTYSYGANPLDGTADKLKDPNSLREYLPRLKEQALWTEFASPAEIKLYEGEMEKWKTLSPDKFDLSGFNKGLLGSKLPKAGVHPRIFFSPEDVPAIAKRYQSSKEKIMAEVVLGNTIWKKGSEDNKWYTKLLEGKLEQLTFKAFHKGPNGNHYFEEHKTKIYITHTSFS